MKKYLLLLSFIIGTASAMETCDPAELEPEELTIPSLQSLCAKEMFKDPQEYIGKDAKYIIPSKYLLTKKLDSVCDENNKLTALIAPKPSESFPFLIHYCSKMAVNTTLDKIILVEDYPSRLTLRDFDGNLISKTDLADMQDIDTAIEQLIGQDTIENNCDDTMLQMFGIDNYWREDFRQAVLSKAKKIIVCSYYLTTFYDVSLFYDREAFLKENATLNELLLLAAIEEKVAKKKKLQLDSSSQALFDSMHPLIQKELEDKGYVNETLAKKFEKLQETVRKTKQRLQNLLA